MIVLPSDPRSTAAAIAAAPRVGDAPTGTPTGGPRAAAGAPSGDRVELSAEARAQAAESGPSGGAEIAGARVALRTGSKLSPARLHELREQVRTGYYDTPEAVDRIAGAAAEDLAPRAA